MKNLKFNFLLAGLLTMLFVAEVQAQEFYKLQTSNSKLSVEGTSTVHDWEIEANNFEAETSLKLNDDVVSEISNIAFTAPVDGLKSGKRIMDNKTHDALKEKKFPQITFSFKKDGNVDFSGKTANVPGELTIAGKTKEVQLSVDFDVETSSRFLVSGTVPLKMSDFGIDPPTAVMGTVKTDDEVVVSFNLEFQRSNEEFSRNF